jgi:DNA-binding HxlR family transcriptional regulator
MTFKRSSCPIANVLDVVGDKWSLLVIRDMALGKRRFAEFLASPEGISTNILTQRLQQLEAKGWVQRVCYQVKPARYEYELSAKGRDFLPVLDEMLRWAQVHLPDTQKFERTR